MSASAYPVTEEIASQTPNVPDIDIEHGLPTGWGGGLKGRLLFGIAIAFSAFQIATAVYAILPSQVLRTVHVGFLVLVSAALIANHRARNTVGLALGWGMGIAGFLVGLYHWIFYNDLVNRAGELLPMDLTVGIVGIVILFIVAWRMMGPALPLICLGFLAYALLGEYLPAPLNHRGYSIEQVVEHMAFGTEGIYGTPTAVSATYIFLFILFGSFLERAGMIQLFNDVAMGLFGSSKGGPAKVAVFSSALMGTISGSGVANVVTTGQFTIPLMKRFGYKPAFAGGVEATASMGGQIMPPVMGAVAFIMAENIGVPYAEIVKAAIIPAILYFGSAFWMVHLEAGKEGLVGMARSELPKPLLALKRQWHLALPLIVLIILLFAGFTPLFSGSVGLALTAILILGNAIAAAIPSRPLRTFFWLGLVAIIIYVIGAAILPSLPDWIGTVFRMLSIPLLAPALFAAGLFTLIAALVVVAALRRDWRQTLVECRDALADGARQALAVGLACAIVGTVIGTMTLTGAATTFGNYIVSFGQESIFLCLVLVMFTSLLLGTGLPTIPTYIITAALAAPALLKLGVPLIVSHMFVFYYGIIADLTPPVALAALAAAPIARASPDAIGWQASRVALAGFLIPFMTVYEPSLMLQDGGAIAAQYGYWIEVAVVLFKALIVVGMSGVAAIGFLFSRTPLVERILAGVAAGLLIGNFPWSDTLGLLVAALVIGLNFARARRIAGSPIQVRL
ncbi:TRAP transporter permease [Microvirga puerhi]|uniref:TRAP transporter permease n=1 Tax=Microvirga puerhi TaxID=2876078 RepID=A0ABS7VPC4_9HYPH|nr:TRAP transporter permease [Microvirga puerhi]MBZ6077403.1 TRAP transporter permease [Microvirga puerhi]